jgi:hypothetical protein
MNPKLYVLACLCVAGSALSFGYLRGTSEARASQPARSSVTVNLLEQNSLATTSERARQLMAALRENNWSANGVDRELLRVPDQDLAQIPSDRADYVPTFWCPSADNVYDEIAFYSMLYVRRDFTVAPGSEGRTQYSGFFLVGYRSGEVEEVPVQDVRILWRDGIGKPVFPGMAEYSSELPCLGSGPSTKATSRKR